MLRFVRRGGAPSGKRGAGLDGVFDGPRVAARRERSVKPSSYVLVSVVFSSLLFVFFLVSDHGFLKVGRQRLELDRMQAEVSQLAAANTRLEEELHALKTNPRAVEKIAREDLGFARANEIVLVLPKGWRERVAPEKRPTPKPAAR